MIRTIRAVAFATAVSLVAMSNVTFAASNIVTIAAQQPAGDDARSMTISPVATAPVATKQRSGEETAANLPGSGRMITKQSTGDGDTGYGDRSATFGSNSRGTFRKQ
jgi:hypothetical protein